MSSPSPVSAEHRLPRELVSGVVWIGACYETPLATEILHSYHSLFLVRGEEASLLVEAGLPPDATTVDAQLAEALADAPPLRYVFLTHQETPHAGGIARILERYPDAVAVGDVRDYHLFFPQIGDRLRALRRSEELDLGGIHVRVLEPVIRDLITTQWLFVPEHGALFTGDGFSFAHYHQAGQCGRVASEVPELEVAATGAIFIEFALHWLRFVDPEPYVTALQRCVDELKVSFIGPTHGLPVTEVAELMPHIHAGLRRAVEAPAL